MDSFTLSNHAGSSENITKGTTSNNTDFLIKKIFIHAKTGIPPQALQEINTLKRLKSKTVLTLHSVVMEADSINFVMEFMPFTLKQLIYTGFPFTDVHIDSIILQICRSMSFLHSEGFVHKFLKPDNIFINTNGNVKLGDFEYIMTPHCHRGNALYCIQHIAPEMLLGATSYTSKVDSWSFACIALEMKAKAPIFAGKDEVDQCRQILRTFGRPEVLPPWSTVYLGTEYPRKPNLEWILADRFEKWSTPKSWIVIKEMLQIDERKRLSMRNAARLLGLYIGEPVEFTVIKKEGSS